MEQRELDDDDDDDDDPYSLSESTTVVPGEGARDDPTTVSDKAGEEARGLPLATEPEGDPGEEDRAAVGGELGGEPSDGEL